VAGKNTTEWINIHQNVVGLGMEKKSKKIRPYKIEEDAPLPLMEEAAVQYESLRVMLGGNKSVKKNITGEFDLIAITRAGIKKSTLKSLAAFLGITMFTMSRLLHTSHRNLQRKDEEEMLDSLKTEKVLELAAFAQRGIEVTGSRQGFIEWLHSPLTSLGNKMPVDFLDTSFGIHLVTKILGRLEQGVYS
jgi:putative toxin-antitoxin system antitoxin component (TIGR02293 family)